MRNLLEIDFAYLCDISYLFLQNYRTVVYILLGDINNPNIIKLKIKVYKFRSLVPSRCLCTGLLEYFPQPYSAQAYSIIANDLWLLLGSKGTTVAHYMSSTSGKCS